MTPEQILINKIKERYLSDHGLAWYGNPITQDIEFLLTKAQEATSAKNAQVQNLLTAHPLAEALRFYTEQNHYGDESNEEDCTFICMGSKNGYPVHIEDGTLAKEALTQHEALIKQSEAVWAVVGEAVALDKKISDGFGASNEQLRRAVGKLPKEALEMMETTLEVKK